MTDPAEVLREALGRLAAAIANRHTYEDLFPPSYLLPHSAASLWPAGGASRDPAEQRRLDHNIAIAMDQYVLAWEGAGRPQPEYIGRAHRSELTGPSASHRPRSHTDSRTPPSSPETAAGGFPSGREAMPDAARRPRQPSQRSHRLAAGGVWQRPPPRAAAAPTLEHGIPRHGGGHDRQPLPLDPGTAADAHRVVRSPGSIMNKAER
jgi:hypothetical protein